MHKRYPHELSRGANNSVIALSTTEVGKLFTDDTRSDIGSEAEKMRFANSVNGLMVSFVHLDTAQRNKFGNARYGASLPNGLPCLRARTP